MSDRRSEEKHFVEVDLSQDDPRQGEFGTLGPLSNDDYDLAPAARIYQLDSRTVSHSDYIEAAATNVINQEIDSAFNRGEIATVEDVLSAFKHNLQDAARDRLDVATDSPAKDAVEAMSAAISLALNEQVMARQPGAGRHRDGVEVKKVTTFRMEPRIRLALKQLGLGPQIIADGFTDLVERHNRDDEDAIVILQILACLFSSAEGGRPIAARLAPESIRRWQQEQLKRILARSDGSKRDD